MGQMTKWRPEGWGKPRCENCPDKQEDEYGLFCNLACGVGSMDEMYEAGADAMLEALRKEGKPSANFTNEGHETGMIVFIPDDEEEK